jgi:hypothetical protein
MSAEVKRMMRVHLNRAFLICATTLLASSAYGQSPNANPHAEGKGHSADEAKKAGDDKAKVGDDKAKAGDDKSKGASDRAARIAKEHGEEKAKLATMLKGPMDSAVKEELRRHAERSARIARIKSLADTAKDTDASDRATKLQAKEDARHDKWMAKHASPATPMPATGTKGGAQ